jgi:hypothetical protein
VAEHLSALGAALRSAPNTNKPPIAVPHDPEKPEKSDKG